MRGLRVAVALACSSLTFDAHAGDGSYGRLKGDTTFVVGASGGVVAHDGRPLVGGDLRLRYLDAAGAVFSYEEAVAVPSSGSLRRAFLAGVELRPLFPVRFLKAYQTGGSFFDLTLDSLALEVGAWIPVRGGTAVRRGGFYTGIAVELPLFARASGLWLRLSTQLRWAPQRLEGEDDPTGRTVVFGLGLAFHQVFGSGLAQRGDEPPH